MAAGVDGETIARLCRLYGLSAPVGAAERIGGTAGTNAHFRTAEGEYFLRGRAAEHADLGQIAYDHELLAYLAGRGLPVQPPMHNRDEATVTRLGERLFELFVWVEGEEFCPGQRERLVDLGRRVAELHAAAAEYRKRKDKPWEQDPTFLLAELDRHAGPCGAAGKERLLERVRQELRQLEPMLGAEVRATLPHAVVHGDLHPANAKFAGQRLVGLFDWDWANYQMRITDVADAVFFFARRGQFDAGEIWSLTSAPSIDADAAKELLAAYETVTALTDRERELLPAFLSARWLQERIRGMRKVAVERRLEFLDRDGDLMEVLAELKGLRV